MTYQKVIHQRVVSANGRVIAESTSKVVTGDRLLPKTRQSVSITVTSNSSSSSSSSYSSSSSSRS